MNATEKTVQNKSKTPEPVRMYLKDLSRLSLLSREEEISLARAVQRGDKEAERKLVEGNLRFVVSIARRYKDQGIPLGDLINEGNIGLIKAAKKFDPSRGTKFISYACWWINSAIKNAISRQRGVISMPFSHLYILHRIKKNREEFLKKNVSEPTMEDLADSLGLSVDCIEKHMQAPDSCFSLDALVSDDSHQSFKDFLTEDDPVAIDRNLEKRDSNKLIRQLLDKIEPRQKKIINMRFGLNGKECLTLRETAKKLNLSYERIRQIQEDSLRSLRDISAEYF